MPQSTTIPPIHHASEERSNSTTTNTSSSSSVNGDSANTGNTKGLQRPKMSSRKSSGTIIVPREHPQVELQKGDEVFDEDDARAMSPRRSSQDLEKMSQDARAQLNEYIPPLPLRHPNPTNPQCQTCQNSPKVPPGDFQPYRSRERGTRQAGQQ